MSQCHAAGEGPEHDLRTEVDVSIAFDSCLSQQLWISIFHPSISGSVSYDKIHIYTSIVPGMYRWDLYLRLLHVFFAGSSLLLAWLGKLWQRLEVGDAA